MVIVPLVDLKSQYDTIKFSIDNAIQTVINKSAFTSGEETDKLEKEFAVICGTRYAVSVASGTAAIHLALQSANKKIYTLDKMIVSPSTFTASVEPAVLLGIEPIFIDIDKDTYCLDPNKVEDKIKQKRDIRYIMVVHQYGHPADMDAFIDIGTRYNITIIEDCSHAHGAVYNKKNVGSFGKAGCFSFMPAKIIGGYGDAGIIVTDDDIVAERIRKLKSHGRSGKHIHNVVGYNFRMDNLQAAIIRCKLEYLSRWTDRRREIAKMYTEGFANLTNLITPFVDSKVSHVYYLYVVQVDNRDNVAENLKTKGIQTGLHYPIPLHMQNAYEEFTFRCESLPNSERLAVNCISLPIYPEMTNEQVNYVIDIIGKIM